MHSEAPAAAAPPADQALAEARWDLEPLVGGEGAEGVSARLDQAEQRSDAFAAEYRGKLAELDAASVAAAMSELEEIADLVGRAGSYASLGFSVDTQSPEAGALMQRVQERAAQLQTTLLFFDLEWNLLEDERAAELLAAPELERWRHHLTTLRRYRPHQLSEPEEQILTETAVTGPSAFARLFTEQISAITVELPDAEQPVQLMEALAVLQDPDRERAPRGRRGRHRGARARASHPCLRLQHPARRQGDQGPPALLRALARLAKPRQRGLRRVGCGADRGGRRALRAGAALVPAQGADPRPRPARPLRPDGAGRRDRAADPLRRGARAGARLLPRLLARARRGRGRVLHRRLHRRAAASPASAAAPSAPTRFPQRTPT